MRDGISRDVTQAFQSEVAVGQRLEVSRTAVAEAQENLCQVRVKYRNGDPAAREYWNSSLISIKMRREWT